MSEIKIGTGNGQGSCYGCEQKGKWNRSWVNLLYEYEDKLWCEDCLIARLHKENEDLKQKLNWIAFGDDPELALRYLRKIGYVDFDEKRQVYINKHNNEPFLLKDEQEKDYYIKDEELNDYTKQLENKQRNFMEWLEDYIDALKDQQESVEGLDSCEQYTLIALEEILSKYKEIIGGDNK